MTREEAINLETEVRYNLTASRHKEAVDLAFAALREQEERSKTEKNVTVKEKIADILNWVQTCGVDWNFMQCLKQELEELVEVAKLEVEG